MGEKSRFLLNIYVRTVTGVPILVLLCSVGCVVMEELLLILGWEVETISGLYGSLCIDQPGPSQHYVYFYLNIGEIMVSSKPLLCPIRYRRPHPNFIV